MRETLEEFSVKQVVLYLEEKSLSIRAVGPADSAELHELRKLNKKGLTKFVMMDVSCHFVAHQGARHKLFDDLSRGDPVFTEILDRTRCAHNIVKIYASQISVKKLGLAPAQFQQLLKEEDEILEKYTKLYKK